MDELDSRLESLGSAKSLFLGGRKVPDMKWVIKIFQQGFPKVMIRPFTTLQFVAQQLVV